MLVMREAEKGGTFAETVLESKMFLASFLVWSGSFEALHKQENLEIILARIIIGGSTSTLADEAKELKECIYTAVQSQEIYCFCILSSLIVSELTSLEAKQNTNLLTLSWGLIWLSFHFKGHFKDAGNLRRLYIE